MPADSISTDVYKWCLKLGPLVPGDLLLDAFELARDIRLTDMQASPYDVSSYELEPVTIETPDGKAEYVHRQRAYAERSNTLRARLLHECGGAPIGGAAAASADPLRAATRGAGPRHGARISA